MQAFPGSGRVAGDRGQGSGALRGCEADYVDAACEVAEKVASDEPRRVTFHHKTDAVDARTRT